MQYNEAALTLYVEARMNQLRQEAIPLALRREAVHRLTPPRHARIAHTRLAVERRLGNCLVRAGERLRAGAHADACAAAQ